MEGRFLPGCQVIFPDRPAMKYGSMRFGVQAVRSLEDDDADPAAPTWFSAKNDQRFHGEHCP